MPGAPEHIHRSCRALPESVGELRRTAVDFARSHGAPAPLLHDIALAVSEATSNAVLHAYRDGDRAGHVHLEAHAQRSMLDIRVSDDGCGMTPRVDSPGAGLGLPIIAKVTDGLEVLSDTGTAILMSFALAGAQPGD